MKICPKCATENADTAKFCNECGTILEIKETKALETVKIVCVSGIVEEDKIEELRHAGANEFLAKPFETEKLIELICRLLEIESFV